MRPRNGVRRAETNHVQRRSRRHAARGLVLVLALAGTGAAGAPSDPDTDPRQTLIAQSDAPGDRLVHVRIDEDTTRAPWMRLDRIAPPPGRVPVGRPAPVQVRYDRAWLDRRPASAARDAEWRCMAIALYFEARGEPVKGQFAVAEVILNRVADPRYPDTVCAVVNQTCQFSFTCDGQPERIREPEAFARVGKVADLMMGGVPRRLTDGATHFHARSVRPDWSRRLPKTTQIGDHVFYRPGRVN